MTEQQQPSAPASEEQVVVVGPDGQPIGTIPASALPAMTQQRGDGEEGEGERHITELVEQPAKVMRIGSMIRQLLEEVKAAPLDEASRQRLKEIHAASIKELESGLAPELVEELERLSLPFTEEGTPSEGELRIAQAQLVGWLEGLFHGIQTAIYAQQMASRAQLEQMRRALPAGAGHAPHPPMGMPNMPTDDETQESGGTSERDVPLSRPRPAAGQRRARRRTTTRPSRPMIAAAAPGCGGAREAGRRRSPRPGSAARSAAGAARPTVPSPSSASTFSTFVGLATLVPPQLSASYGAASPVARKT